LGYVFLECGCAEEIQPESIEQEKKMRTTIVKGCLYCGLWLPAGVNFCPECGRPVERGRIPHATLESDSDCLDAENVGKDDLVRQHEGSSKGCGPLVDEIHRMREEREHVHLIRTPTMVATRNG
jgi:hypothetical protein